MALTLVISASGVANSGQTDWLVQFGTVTSDGVSGVAFAGGNLYVAGFTSVTPRLGDNDPQAFLRKYSPDGDLIWSHLFGTADLDAATAVAADSSGIYVAGITLGAFPTYTNLGSWDVFVRKYDADGNVVWTRQFGTTTVDNAAGIAVYPSPHLGTTAVYVAGTTQGALDGPNQGLGDAFVREYGDDGRLGWTRQFGTAAGDSAAGVEANSTGIYVAGSSDGVLPGQTVPTGRRSAFLRNYTASGTEQWTRQFIFIDESELRPDSSAEAVAVYGGAAYIAGTDETPGAYGAPVFAGRIRKYDSSGNLGWTIPAAVFPAGLDADAGGVTVAGSVRLALTCETSAGDTDAGAARYDTAGVGQWVRQLGTSASDQLLGVASVAGATFGGGAAGGAFPGYVDQDGDPGLKDAFVARLSLNTAPRMSVANPAVAVDEGSAAGNSGTYCDADLTNTVSLSTSLGGLTKTGSNSGTWAWEYRPDDGPATVSVGISGNDGRTGTADASFSLTVRNVPPHATLNVPTAVIEGSPIHLSMTNPGDPGPMDVAAGFNYAFDCGTGYGSFAAAAAADCSTDDSGSRGVGAEISDKDGGQSEYRAAVGVANAPPTATLQAPAFVNTGRSFSLALVNPTDPSSVDTAAGFSYAFDCGSGYGPPSPASTATCTGGAVGTQVVRASITDKDGGISEYSRTVNVDSGAAPVAAQPRHALVSNSQLGTSLVPIRLTWSASDPSGIAQYRLQQRTYSAGAWGSWFNVALSSPTATAVTRSLAVGPRYQFRVSAQDGAGNWSVSAAGSSFTLRLFQETSTTIAYGGAWVRVASSGASGGYVRSSSAKGARARFSFTGRQVAFVSDRSPSRGKAALYLDGVYIGTLDLYAASAQARRVVFVRSFASLAAHTLEVRLTGTKNVRSSGVRVVVDAFLTLT